MIKFRLTSIVGSLLAFAAAAASGAQYTDTDLQSLNLNMSTTGTSVYNGTFDITDEGFNPNSEYVWLASASFNFADDASDPLLQRKEEVKVTLDNSWFLQGQGSQSSTTGNFSLNLLILPFLGGQILWDISQDGKLDFTVKATKGDFILKSAYLTAWTISKPGHGVPDGGTTLVLLGVGLLGLLGLKRKQLASR